ncbi:MAG: galactokinase [Bdellovibrionota bacterium]
MKTIEAISNGRVNLIGEHTDYNDGWVLPTAIPQATRVRLTPREDMMVIGRTALRGGDERYEIGSERARAVWIDYVQGATKILHEEGHPIKGFEIEVASTVPTGSGLSSSAALEVATLKALREAYALKLDDPELARIGQRIENEFVGARVGIMDQMACALARFGEALFLDTKSLEFERIKIPMDELGLIVINSGVVHSNSGGDYNTRRAECEKACAQLGIPSLRHTSIEEVESSRNLGPTEKKRARHVVTENARVHAAVAALKKGDLATLGRLFYESHASMRDDYAVSVQEIDLLVELCREQTGVFGARLTGGGFGGSIVALAEKGRGGAVAREVVARYGAKVSTRATILVSE